MNEYPNDKTNKLRYIAYVRKSTEDEEKQVLSKDAQKDKIQERFPNLTIVDTLDESKSAFEPEKRDVFKKVIEMLDNGEIDGIIAWHPDRLSRNEVDASTITWRIRRGIIKDLKFANYNFDNSPEGMMMLQMTMSQSQYFSAKLSKDVKRGNEKKRKIGGICGRAPEGYLNDRIGKTVYKDPKRFPLLRKAVDLYLTGEYSVQQILDIMNNEWGYRTVKRKRVGGKAIGRTSLYYMFRNVRYAGWIPDPYDEDKLYPADFPALMTQDEYDKIQLLLGRQGGKRFAARKQFVLRGFIRCGECGCMITAQSKERHYPSGVTRIYTYYHCTAKRPCNQKVFGYKKEDELFKECVEELNNWELIPELYDWSMDAINQMAQAETPERQSVENMQQQAIDSLKSQYDILLDMSTRKLVDEETFVAKAAKLKAELKELHKQQTTVAKNTENWYDYMTDLIIKFMNVNAKFVNGDIADKKEILLAIGQNPVLLDGKLQLTPNEWLLPLKNNTRSIKAQVENARTMTEQMKNSLLEALRLEWCARQDSNLRPLAPQANALSS
jgi:site-specific DNA recombinase